MLGDLAEAFGWAFVLVAFVCFLGGAVFVGLVWAGLVIFG